MSLIDRSKAEILENYRLSELLAGNLRLRVAELEALTLRWNKAAARFAAGSEYIDAPERVFVRIGIQMEFAKELGRRLGPVPTEGVDPENDKVCAEKTHAGQPTPEDTSDLQGRHR